MISMRIKLFSFILLFNVFQTLSFANDEGDSEFSADYGKPCNPLLDNKYICFAGRNDCEINDVMNKNIIIGMTEGLKCDGKFFQRYGTRSVCAPQGDSSYTQKYRAGGPHVIYPTVDDINESGEGLLPNVLFSENHDDKIFPCEENNECGQLTFCQQVHFTAEEMEQVPDIDKFNRKIANKFKGLFNIPYEYELVDENNVPYKKLCMPHARCVPDCLEEGEELSENSVCCPGLLRGKDYCVDPTRRVMPPSPRFTFNMSESCGMGSIDATYKDDFNESELQEEYTDLKGNFCSIAGLMTKKACEDKEGIWLLNHITSSKFERYVNGLEWLWKEEGSSAELITDDFIREVYSYDTFFRVSKAIKSRRKAWENYKHKELGAIEEQYHDSTEGPEGGVSAFETLIKLESVAREVSIMKSDHFWALMAGSVWGFQEDRKYYASDFFGYPDPKEREELDDEILESFIAHQDVIDQYKTSPFRLFVKNQIHNVKHYFHKRRAPKGAYHWHACEDPFFGDSYDVYCKGKFEDVNNGRPECRDGVGEIFQSYRNCTDISVIVNEEDDEPIDSNTLVELYHENWGQNYHQGAIRKNRNKATKNELMTGGLVNPIVPLVLIQEDEEELYYMKIGGINPSIENPMYRGKWYSTSKYNLISRINYNYSKYANKPLANSESNRVNIEDSFSPYEFLYFARQENPAINLSDLNGNQQLMQDYREQKRDLALFETSNHLYEQIMNFHFTYTDRRQSDNSYHGRYNTFSILSGADRFQGYRQGYSKERYISDSASKGRLYGGLEELFYRLWWLRGYYSGIVGFHEDRIACLCDMLMGYKNNVNKREDDETEESQKPRAPTQRYDVSEICQGNYMANGGGGGNLANATSSNSIEGPALERSETGDQIIKQRLSNTERPGDEKVGGLGNTKSLVSVSSANKKGGSINKAGAGANIDNLNRNNRNFAKISGKKASKRVLEYRQSLRDINEGRREFLDENGFDKDDFEVISGNSIISGDLNSFTPADFKKFSNAQFSTKVAAVTRDTTDGYKKKTFNNTYSRKKKKKKRKKFNLFGSAKREPNSKKTINKRKILKAIKKSEGKYEKAPGDSLFNIITKTYIRRAYRDLLKLKQK